MFVRKKKYEIYSDKFERLLISASVNTQSLQISFRTPTHVKYCNYLK